MPSFVHWPKVIRPGRTSELITTLDILPTLSALSGVKLPNTTLDGVNILPYLLDKDSKVSFVIFICLAILVIKSQ